MASVTEERKDLMNLETEKQEASDFMSMLKEMSPEEKESVRNIMIGIRIGRKTA